MKRQLLSFLLPFAISANINAQTVISGSFDCLSTEKAVCIKWDFTNTVFEKKYNEQEWTELKGTEEWDNAKKEAMDLIIENVNEMLKKEQVYVVKESERANYVITIFPLTLDKKGNNKSEYVLTDIKGKNEEGRILIKGDGGHWGNLANLLGDGYEEAARKLGKYIRKCIHEGFD